MESRRGDKSITAQKPPQGALTRLYMRRTPHGTSRAKKNHMPARRDSMVRFRFSKDFSLHRSKRWWARRIWPSHKTCIGTTAHRTELLTLGLNSLNRPGGHEPQAAGSVEGAPHTWSKP